MIQRLDAPEPKPEVTDGYVRPRQQQTEWMLPLDHREEPIVFNRPPLRKLRMQIVLACLAFTLGGLFIILSSPYRNEFLAPGPLTQGHAQLLAANGGDRCAACHAAGNGSFSQWLTDALSGGAQFPTEQITLCMNCHQSQIEQTLARMPHTMPPDALAAITGRQQERWQTTGNWMLAGGNQRDALACAECHREHHGAHFNLTALSDSACQTCHVQSFARFESDHPPFRWESRAKTSALNFDHRTHSAQHFGKHGQTFDCRQCHEPDGARNVMLTRSFAEACAQCHQSGVEDSLQPGIVWFRLPALDPAKFAAENVDIGSWPPELSTGFDGQLTPYMHRLLQADHQVATALKKLGPEFRFEDLEDAAPGQLQDAAIVVWGIKRLLWDLASRGPEAIQDQIRLNQTETPANSEWRQRLLPFLNELLFREAVLRWLPELVQESRQFGADQGNPPPVADEIGWFPGAGQVALRWALRQDEELVPNPIAALLQGQTPPTLPANAGNSQSPARPQSSAPLAVPLQSEEKPATWKNELRAADDKGVGNSGLAVAANEKSGAPAQVPPGLADNQTLLIDNPINRLDNSVDNSPVAGQVSQRNLIKDPAGNLDSQRSQSDASPNSQNANHSDSEPATGSFSFSTPALSAAFERITSRRTGWHRDDQLFQLTYYPTGHADPFLTAWTELAVREQGVKKPADGDGNYAGNEANSLSALTVSSHPGQCLLCHQTTPTPAPPATPAPKEASLSTAATDSSSNYQLRMGVLWQSALRSVEKREFTRFNHAPHLLLQDCTSCHKLSDDVQPSGDASFTSPVALRSGRTLTAQFQAITVDQCATCHRENQSPNQCTTCHNYHIGSLPSVSLPAIIPPN